MRRQWVLAAAVAVAAAAGGFAFNVWRTAPQAAANDAVAALKTARLPDTHGVVRSIDQWDGKVVVVNFWATWCAPCRDEIPILVKLQEKHAASGLQIVGIAIDQPEKVRPYAAEMRMNFPSLIGGVDAIELSRKLGNKAGVLPFTVVLDRRGKIAERHIGAIKEGPFEAKLTPIL